MIKNYIYKIVFLVVFIIVPASNYAQSGSKVDSLVRESTLNIYKNPDQAIQTGKYIFSNNESNPENKIKGLILISDGYTSRRNYQKSLEMLLKAKSLSNLSTDDLLKIKLLYRLAAQYQQLKIHRSRHF